jgi:TPP-dependent pyruvate/acetoin dehydrogenase alpha subunit
VKKEKLLEMYRRMQMIRQFEEQVNELYTAGADAGAGASVP